MDLDVNATCFIREFDIPWSLRGDFIAGWDSTTSTRVVSARRERTGWADPADVSAGRRLAGRVQAVIAINT
jgi:hypothetical protein